MGTGETTAFVQSPCIRCGSFVPLNECLYSDEGDIMCLRCREFLDKGQQQRRALRVLQASAWGSAFSGFVGLVASPFFPAVAVFVGGPAIASGARVLWRLKSDSAAREGLGIRLFPTAVAGFLGLSGGVIALLIFGAVFFSRSV